MECRSEERRQYIVNNYNVVPVAHIQLLNGQTKHSDAGRTIENDYYIFEATSKIDGKQERIQCGMTAAKDCLYLILCMAKQKKKEVSPLEEMKLKR